MSKRQVLLVLGIWIMIFLFISFPAAWDKVFALITGLMIVTIAFKLPPQHNDSSRKNVPYVESRSENVQRSEPVSPKMNDIIKNETPSESL